MLKCYLDDYIQFYPAFLLWLCVSSHDTPVAACTESKFSFRFRRKFAQVQRPIVLVSHFRGNLSVVFVIKDNFAYMLDVGWNCVNCSFMLSQYVVTNSYW